MGKEHFDLPAQASWVLEGLRVLKGDNVLPDALIEWHGQSAFWAARALLADGTPEAVTGRCPIHMYLFFLSRRSMFQYLALRTDKDIAFGIEGESPALEQAAVCCCRSSTGYSG
jgi:hypothetical protein